jgi:LDH2 family malate/lactate/ureidoglycolate dehydrogenase
MPPVDDARSMTAQTRPSGDGDDLLIDAAVLASLSRECFERLGVPTHDAQAVTDVLIDANLHGVPSHGFQRVPIYMRRVHAGLAGGTQRLSIVSQSGALCQMDAHDALGPAASVKAVDRSLALAREFGIGLVAVGRSTHFGPAGYYARRAAAAGFVSIVMSNAVKRMAPYGAADAFLGTNPIAVGVPLADHDPFVLDMSTSIAAQGRITRAKLLEEQIPDGLALGPDGQPTTDPAAALAGSLLPVGGPKGSGLALAIGMLAVLLADAAADDQMGSMYKDFSRPQDSGHIFIAVDGSRLGDRQRRLDEMIERLGALRPLEGCGAVEYPGQAGARLARERRRDGVPIRPAELLDAAQTCDAMGLGDLEQRALALLDR